MGNCGREDEVAQRRGRLRVGGSGEAVDEAIEDEKMVLIKKSQVFSFIEFPMVSTGTPSPTRNP